MRFFVALFLFVFMIFIAAQSYRLYEQKDELSVKKNLLDAQASALVIENHSFSGDLEYFKNENNLTKELQTKASYRKPDEKMFMLLPASPSEKGAAE